MMDHVFILSAIIEVRQQSSKFFCCFVDFSMAFDMVSRASLFQRLWYIGLLESLILVLPRLYEMVEA